MMINSLSRRDFLKSTCAVGIGAAFAGHPSFASNTVLGDSGFWSLPRTLNLVRPKTQESLSVSYFDNDRVNNAGYLQICNILRDVQANQAVYMDWHLLDTLRAIQGYMESYGYRQPIIINSGYRTPRTNAMTEGAAKNSLHMQGRAVDFTMPGVPSNYMGQLASYFKAGGVGFYPSDMFTHIDTGAIRQWTVDKHSSRYPMGNIVPQ